MAPASSDRPRACSGIGLGVSSSILLVLALLLPSSASATISLSHQEAMRVGRKIWQNECDGSVAGLTSWNAGENFASLGIGHFICYPPGARGPG